ncbi:MAG: tRNA guanosine(34) transglycosylase Tgt [Phycisphaerae bacterium]
MLSIQLQATEGKARRGELTTSRGQADTPAFMPVGTAGSVKGLTAHHIAETGSQILLANTYHLLCRPGPETVAELGGVHKMMAWEGPMLTDSGGFQVFSLSDLRQIDDQAVTFKSHVDGSTIRLSPARAVEVQRHLGADIMMQLDVCPPGQAPREEVAAAVDRSADWARLCLDAWQEADRRSVHGHDQALLGIQQGGVHLDLRAESARRLVELDLPGHAVGGLSVGEGHEAMKNVLDEIDSQLPADKPRYLMGVGEPRDILQAVLRGIDMFDCVMPTRNGRNAQAFTWTGRLRLRNAHCTDDSGPIEADCACYACRNYSRGTIRHLFMAREMLGPILVTIHNLHWFADFMAAIRQAIEDRQLTAKAETWMQQLYPAARDDP